MFNNVDFLATRFLGKRNKDWIIFTGSAISFNLPSSLPSVDLIKSISLDFLSEINSNKISSKDLKRIFKYKNSFVNGNYKKYFENIPFETYMSLLHRNIPSFSHNLISDIYGLKASKLFNVNHMIIALLLKHKYIRQVITTNYDLLLEEALKFLNIKPETLIIQDDKKTKALKKLTKSKNFLDYHIVKLHGCCSVKKSVVFTEESIDRYREKTLDILPYLLEDSNVIFIGYSGKDYLDIMPVIYELANNKKIKVYWLYRDKKNIPQNLKATFIKNDLAIEKGGNRNTLIALAEKVGVGKLIINRFKPMPMQRDLYSKISPIIRKNIKNSPNSNITSLKALATIFEHIKIGDVSLELAEISRKIKKNSFSYSDYGRFYEILRLYPLAIYSFRKSLNEKPSSINKRISDCCSLAFCQAAIFLLSLSYKNYKLAEQLSSSSRSTINNNIADALIRGQIELLLKSIEARILSKRQKNERIAKVAKLLNESRKIYKFNSTLLSLFKRNKARLKILQAKDQKDFLDAEKEAREAFEIAKARNQFEAMTVIIRTLAITKPKKYLTEMQQLIIESWKRSYWQEWIKLSVSYFLNKNCKNQKKILFINKFFKMLLSYFLLFKAFFITIIVWYLKRFLKLIIYKL